MKELNKEELQSISGGSVPIILLPNGKLVKWILGLFK
ncbi:class IIb bacteriocin, lactobin A/cerein 7B family [Streptococcus suis]|uniref:Class IIb bacteriocin, lactobin A/cerein 7B family n=1 Tax=Streptococcus suis TaxID=1307 RepID=A0A3R8SAT7_STRSU|nr:class IIb bacteriocin, lactobin A/cerein 7B family [Streptococcus suis]MCQ8261996.1 class IIb bacteriocin, lactobin A/cerein 7B family [Streptococcus suis]MDG4507601.1 class IIb bacteriocin, lactobin A/cerein 7B family [Streptococcus suis]NQI35811.1 class IIb bacteriocin, lactobin A/cerein 7B family [Streptococcus suis]NQI37680.1 class IIb bacteriocin, lactobin A/cerein 7B family [Streptococcus suis]NQI47349.1 class IIb bacteriocin, lactobin A/cerein 7B family [Streptococcus suis]